MSETTHEAIRAVFRIESPRLVAGLARMVRDVGVAEELAQDAMLAALEQWPASGVPDNPGAWLMASAKNRAINVLRRRKMLARKHEAIAKELDEHVEIDLDDDYGDDLLRLIFTACHPVVPAEGRVALTLRLLGGLSTDEIARAFLVSEPTIAQRIVRAKRTLGGAKVPFEVPSGGEREERLASVLSVLYLIFNEGYSASAGDDVMRPALCEEAMRMGRVLAALMQDEAEAHGLIALMELNASRSAARTGPNGEPILLMDQDRSRWNRLLVTRGLQALDRARALEGHGPYVLQAEIAACHARAAIASETDWSRIATLYAELHTIAPSPIVELNRAVAVAMAHGPARGLEIADALSADPALADYPLLPSARADFLEKLGRLEEARAEFERAASLTENAQRRQRLLERAAKCAR